MLTFCGKCKAMGNFKKSMSCWHFMKERIAMHIWFISWTLRAEVYVQKKAIQMYRSHIWVMTNLLEICSAPKNMFTIFYMQNYFAYFIVRSKCLKRKKWNHITIYKTILEIINYTLYSNTTLFDRIFEANLTILENLQKEY